MAVFTEERLFLLMNYNNILSLVGRNFDSGDFIVAFESLYPNEYAATLNKHGSYQSLNSWIARWVLNELANENILIKNDKKHRISKNRNNTENRTWIKL